MHNRRPFIIASLDEHADAFIKAAFMDAGETPLLFSPPRFFKPAYAAHVDKFGYVLLHKRNFFRRETNNAWLKEARNYPSFQERQLNKKISYLPITEEAYDGSRFNFWDADELTQWRPLWTYQNIDLNLCIKRLLKMDTLFDEDYKKLLEWLKTRGKPFYLTGGEYHNLTNPRAYRHGLFVKALIYMEMFSASFKTY